MLKKILCVVSVLALAGAQIPALTRCPDYVPMTEFDMSKFLGVWYEAERYFQISELGTRCAVTNYTQEEKGTLRVSHEVTNRFTGIKRVLEGEIKTSNLKADLGKFNVKYTVPFTPELKYTVLETDYKSYALLWSCSGIGLLNAQNAWLMTRSRQPDPETIQAAYGVLDKYKISKTFFVKTNQADCAPVDNLTPAKPAENAEQPAVQEAAEEEVVEEQQQARNVVNFGSGIVPNAPSAVVETSKADVAEAAEKPETEAAIEVKTKIQPDVLPKAVNQIEAKPEIQNAEPVEAVQENKEESNVVEKAVEAEISPPASVPQVILKTADRAKELDKVSTEDAKQFQPFEIIQEALANPIAQFQETFGDPVAQIQGAFAKPVAQIQEALAKPAAQLQEAFSKPFQQIQQTFAGPLQNIQQAFNIPPKNKPNAIEKPNDKINDAPEKLVETIKETPNVPAAEATSEKLPEEIKEKEATPKVEEKKEELEKIEP